MNAISKKRIYKKIRPACLLAAALALCSCSSSSQESSVFEFGSLISTSFTFSSFAEFNEAWTGGDFFQTDEYSDSDTPCLDFLIPNLDDCETPFTLSGSSRLFTCIQVWVLGENHRIHDVGHFEVWQFLSVEIRYHRWDVPYSDGESYDFDISLPYTRDLWGLYGSYDSNNLSYEIVDSEGDSCSATVTFSYGDQLSWDMNVAWDAAYEDVDALSRIKADSVSEWLASLALSHMEYFYVGGNSSSSN